MRLHQRKDMHQVMSYLGARTGCIVCMRAIFGRVWEILVVGGRYLLHACQGIGLILVPQYWLAQLVQIKQVVYTRGAHAIDVREDDQRV